MGAASMIDLRFGVVFEDGVLLFVVWLGACGHARGRKEWQARIYCSHVEITLHCAPKTDKDYIGDIVLQLLLLRDIDGRTMVVGMDDGQTNGIKDR